MNQKSFILVLGSKEYEIPSKFNHLSDISTDIYDTLIFSLDHQYTVKSKVSEDVFESFLKYWVSGDVPDIRVDNFFEYSQLSDEFNLLKEQIQQKKKEFGSLLNQNKSDEKQNIMNSNPTDISLEDELDKLQKIMIDQSTKIENISSELNTIKINEQKQFKEINIILTNQSQKIADIQKKYDSDISLINKKVSNQLEEFKNDYKKQKKELVQMKYKHAKDTDNIKNQMKTQEKQIAKLPGGNSQDIKFIKKDHTKRNPGKSFKISYDSTESGRFKGIINYLTEECNGNVHKNGAVELTSSSVLKDSPRINIPLLPFMQLNDNDNYNPYNAADLDDKKSCFESNDIPNSWLCYDFVDAKVKPNAYSIRTYMNGHSHMKSWRFEGSDDKVNWDLLDEQTDNYSINDCGKSNTFIISDNKVNNYYRFLRIKQTDQNIQNSDIMNISAVEFFGWIFE